jgi:hypothetical protein
MEVSAGCRAASPLSLEEKIDTNSAAGELVFHVFGAIAHFERRLIRNAQKTASPPHVRAVSGQEANPRALKLAQAGLSPTAVARQLGLGRSTVWHRRRTCPIVHPNLQRGAGFGERSLLGLTARFVQNRTLSGKNGDLKRTLGHSRNNSSDR